MKKIVKYEAKFKEYQRMSASFFIYLGLETWIITYHRQRKYYSDQVNNVRKFLIPLAIRSSIRLP